MRLNIWDSVLLHTLRLFLYHSNWNTKMLFFFTALLKDLKTTAHHFWWNWFMYCWSLQLEYSVWMSPYFIWIDLLLRSIIWIKNLSCLENISRYLHTLLESNQSYIAIDCHPKFLCYMLLYICTSDLYFDLLFQKY